MAKREEPRPGEIFLVDIPKASFSFLSIWETKRLGKEFFKKKEGKLIKRCPVFLQELEVKKKRPELLKELE